MMANEEDTLSERLESLVLCSPSHPRKDASNGESVKQAEESNDHQREKESNDEETVNATPVPSCNGDAGKDETTMTTEDSEAKDDTEDSEKRLNEQGKESAESSVSEQEPENERRKPTENDEEKEDGGKEDEKKEDEEKEKKKEEEEDEEEDDKDGLVHRGPQQNKSHMPKRSNPYCMKGKLDWRGNGGCSATVYQEPVQCGPMLFPEENFNTPPQPSEGTWPEDEKSELVSDDIMSELAQSDFIFNANLEELSKSEVQLASEHYDLFNNILDTPLISNSAEYTAFAASDLVATSGYDNMMAMSSPDQVMTSSSGQGYPSSSGQMNAASPPYHTMQASPYSSAQPSPYNCVPSPSLHAPSPPHMTTLGTGQRRVSESSTGSPPKSWGSSPAYTNPPSNESDQSHTSGYNTSSPGMFNTASPLGPPLSPDDQNSLDDIVEVIQGQTASEDSIEIDKIMKDLIEDTRRFMPPNTSIDQAVPHMSPPQFSSQFSPQPPPQQLPPQQPPPQQPPPQQPPPQQLPPQQLPPQQPPPQQPPPQQPPPQQLPPQQPPPQQLPPQQPPPQQPPPQQFQPQQPPPQQLPPQQPPPQSSRQLFPPQQFPPQQPFPQPATSRLLIISQPSESQRLPVTVTEFNSGSQQPARSTRQMIPILPKPQPTMAPSSARPVAPPPPAPPRQAPPTQPLRYAPGPKMSPAAYSNTHMNEMAKASLQIAKLSQDQVRFIDDEGDSMLHMWVVSNPVYALALIHRLNRERFLPELINHRNRLKQTPLYLAVVVKAVDVVAELVKHGADVNAEAVIPASAPCSDVQNRATPLHAAARTASAHLTHLLLTAPRGDCCVDATNYNGETPLMFAIREHGEKERGQSNQPKKINDSRETIRKLLQHGASLSARDHSNGRTPLHHLVEKKNYELLEFVLNEARLIQEREFKATGNMNNEMSGVMNAVTFDGNTALHLAAGLAVPDAREHERIVRLLLSHGTDATLRNANNQAPKDIVFQKRQNVIDALRGQNKNRPTQQGPHC